MAALAVTSCTRRDLADGVTAQGILQIELGDHYHRVRELIGAPYAMQRVRGYGEKLQPTTDVCTGDVHLSYGRPVKGAYAYPLVGIALRECRVMSVGVYRRPLFGIEEQPLYLMSRGAPIHQPRYGPMKAFFELLR